MPANRFGLIIVVVLLVASANNPSERPSSEHFGLPNFLSLVVVVVVVVVRLGGAFMQQRSDITIVMNCMVHRTHQIHLFC